MPSPGLETLETGFFGEIGEILENRGKSGENGKIGGKRGKSGKIGENRGKTGKIGKTRWGAGKTGENIFENKKLAQPAPVSCSWWLSGIEVLGVYATYKIIVFELFINAISIHRSHIYMVHTTHQSSL